jgi:hypothetical protein
VNSQVSQKRRNLGHPISGHPTGADLQVASQRVPRYK